VSDVRDIVGNDLEPEELDRLQRLHALLEKAGPPPELSPSLANAPEPSAARVIPFPRRYRYTAVAAAAVAAASLFGVGYLVGASDDGPVRTVAMSGGGATAQLDLFEKDDAGNWPMELHVRGLPEGRYELWLTRKGDLAAPCGIFAVARDDTSVPLNAPYALREFDGWVVTRAGSEVPVLTT
jgi:hypothetical protein